MYSTKGIEAVATITELRSKTSELVEHAKNIERGILIQKNNEPYAVLISYDLYLKLLGEQAEPVQTTTRRRRGRKKRGGQR
ncbi:type II toxin-antitoxin system Phd/YefM family antitoxin [Rhodothermus marinus]|uniref:type II toxin-antitoxin system Phd/YefM family antitoxin n=1 Tax=Rhodothermus marinus TaxID=29549 RepID=UPI0006D1ABBA|nr:type II toxin-antitoxin system Phd/YefM family antitoxin [Rhodothermus marinus]